MVAGHENFGLVARVSGNYGKYKNLRDGLHKKAVLAIIKRYEKLIPLLECM